MKGRFIKTTFFKKINIQINKIVFINGGLIPPLYNNGFFNLQNILKLAYKVCDFLKDKIVSFINNFCLFN